MFYELYSCITLRADPRFLEALRKKNETQLSVFHSVSNRARETVSLSFCLSVCLSVYLSVSVCLSIFE